MEKTPNINELNMDMSTYNKIKGKLNPDDKKNVTITGDKPQSQSSQSSQSSTSMSSMMEGEVIEPKDVNTIKYLSNVKDKQTGEVSKPFTISDKRYQMVRGENGKKEVVIGVYCFDDLNEIGENIIHPLDYFEEKIAKPMKEAMGMVGQDIQVNDGFDYAASEVEYHDKANLMDYLNLKDIEPIYRHFFVNLETGDVTAKFKNTKEIIKSGIKLGPNEDYMDVKTLKKYRFGDYFKKDITEAEEQTDGTDVTKLKADVKKLVTLIKNKFGTYLSKLDKPIEQAEFLNTMAAEVGIPLNKLSSIVRNYRDIANQEEQPINESRVFTKKELEKINKKVIKRTTVKNLFNE
jgi:hypothetical protein